MEDATVRTMLLPEGCGHYERRENVLRSAVVGERLKRIATVVCCIYVALLLCTVTSKFSVPLVEASVRSSKHYAKGRVIELSKFNLRRGISVPQFLQRASALEPFFVSTNDTIQRSLALNQETGEWTDIVYWSTMTAALNAAKDITSLPAAQPFLKSINATTLQMTHSIIKLDWMPMKKGPVVEVAAFSLVHGVSDTVFVRDAQATTAFFKRIGTAKHRVLAQGDDLSTWYDVVYWSSVKDAMNAAKEIEQVEAARPFLDAINSTSSRLDFAYYDVRLWQDFKPQTFFKALRDY